MTQLQSLGSPLRVAWSNHTLLIIRQQTPSFQRAHLFFHHRPAGPPKQRNEGQAWGKEGPCAHYLTPSPVAARDFLSLLSPELGIGFPTSGQTLTLSSTYIKPLLCGQPSYRCWIHSKKQGSLAHSALPLWCSVKRV